MSELKPCPFCGEILDTIPNRSIWDIVTFYEHPNNPECQLSGLLFSENWWNTRPIEDALLARAECAETKAKELETGTYCAYCGERFELDDSAAVRVGEHIATCEKHPMRKLNNEILRLQRMLDWAMKPEDQQKLQQQFDDLDEREKLRAEYLKRERRRRKNE